MALKKWCPFQCRPGMVIQWRRMDEDWEQVFIPAPQLLPLCVKKHVVGYFVRKSGTRNRNTTFDPALELKQGNFINLKTKTQIGIQNQNLTALLVEIDMYALIINLGELNENAQECYVVFDSEG